MQLAGFIGASYVSSSVSVDCERSMNLYPETITAPGTTPKARLVLRRRPGLSLLQTLPDSPGRGVFSLNGRCFVVAGASFFELTSLSTYVLRGTLTIAGTSAVQMCGNGVQIGLVADGLFYCFTLASNAFVQISSVSQPGLPASVSSICSIDTYFIALGANSTQFGVSNPLDGTTWSALSFGSSQEPDNAVAVAASHLYLWIFGSKETIIFQDTGATSTPFQRLPGSQIEQGCGAANSIVIADNTLFWLGADERGSAVIYRADGFLPSRISTQAIEEAIQGYSTVADAVAYAYQESGHLFYVLDFPSANGGAGATWAYDVSSQMWHERAYWNVGTGTYSSMLARFHTFWSAYSLHVCADYTSGNVYQMSRAFPSDGAAPIRWLRASPHVHDEDNAMLFFGYFQLDMETGAGLPGNAQSTVMFRFSDDGGFSWRSTRYLPVGAIGEYKRRVRANRCGRSRSRVWEVSGSDPLPNLTLIAAYADVDKGLL